MQLVLQERGLTVRHCALEQGRDALPDLRGQLAKREPDEVRATRLAHEARVGVIVPSVSRSGPHATGSANARRAEA